jgi:hypothetical protein
MSRFDGRARQLVMRAARYHPWRWLTAAVLIHLAASLAHGATHVGAQVPLSPVQSLFVYLVIFAGPPAGLALAWVSRGTGSWLVALTLAGALIFGVITHFVLPSPDHVSRVAAAWRPIFATTAASLAVLEAAGAGLAFGIGGGKASAARRPLVGRDEVVNFLVGIHRTAERDGTLRQASLRLEDINSEPALVLRVRAQLESIFVLSVDADAIIGIRVVRNPDKLARIDRQLTVH